MLSLPTGPYQFKGKTFELTVSDSRLHIELLTDEDSARIDAIVALRTTLRLLGQTPVSAFGINFCYETDADLNSYIRNINQTLEAQYTKVKCDIKWALFDDNRNSTNIVLRRNSGSNTFRIDVNFNYPIDECLQIMTMIGDDAIITSRERDCEQLLKEMFNIETDK